MTPELQAYYEAQFDLFVERGWEDFIEDVQGVKAALPTIEQISTEAQLHYVKGQLDIIKWVLQRRELIGKAYEDLKED